MPDEKKQPRAGTDAGHSRDIRRNLDKHTLRQSHRNINRDYDKNAGGFPGVDLDGHTLAEILLPAGSRNDQKGGV